MVIKNVNVLVGDGNIINNASIVIKGNKIEKIVPSDCAVADDNVIYGNGMLAMPGLVNTHTHAAMTFLRNYANDMNLQDWLFTKIFPAEDKLTAQMAYWCVKLADIEMIKAGVTCYSDNYFFMDDAARAVEETGIRAVLSRSVSGISDPEGKKLKESCDFFKQYNNTADGRITSTLGAHAIYTSDTDYIRKVVECADKLGSGLQIHLAETVKEVEDCIAQNGVTPTEYLDKIGYFDVEGVKIAAHCVHMTDNDLDIIKEKGVSVAANIGSNLKLASGIPDIPKMMAKGINVSLGTDGASSNNNLSIFNEMRLAGLLYKGLSMDPLMMNADEVIRLATANGARAVGTGCLGEIKEGNIADIILVDTTSPSIAPVGEPAAAVVYSACGGDVDTVIINGKTVMAHRAVLTCDEEEAVDNVNQIARQILG